MCHIGSLVTLRGADINPGAGHVASMILVGEVHMVIEGLLAVLSLSIQTKDDSF